jgi:ribosomal protein S18 acetylase RimI-like enzyme
MSSISSGFSIKKAGEQHAEILSKIGGDTFYETFKPYNTESDIRQYISKAYAIDVIKQNLINPNIVYYLCYDADVVIGYIKLIHHATYKGLTNHTIELEKIYVLASYFGSGAGKLLMDCAITHSKEAGFDTLFLGVWQENERAVNFYKKIGFEVFETRQFQLGERLCDDYMMKLKL